MENFMRNQKGALPLRAILIVLCIVVVLLGGERLFYLRQLSILKDNVAIIEGEAPLDSNYLEGNGYISKDFKFLDDRAIQLSTPVKNVNGYYFTYSFSVPEDGEYNIVIAGTPPGPRAEGSVWNSPYTVSIDDLPGVALYEEDLKENWPVYINFNYAKGGYYFVKVMTVPLTAGEHQIRINVNTPRLHDGHYTIYLDAILISPVGFKPYVGTKKIPKELFAAL